MHYVVFVNLVICFCVSMTEMRERKKLKNVYSRYLHISYRVHYFFLLPNR